MRIMGKRQKGLSLIEMLIAMVIALMIIGGVYRTFTAQQKTYVVQEQVSEAQQSVRAVMDLIARDIRMAGFGRPAWAVGGLSESVTITVAPSPRVVTLQLVGAFGAPFALLDNDATMGQNQIILDRSEILNQNTNLLLFEQYYDSEPDGDPLASPIPSIRYTNAVVWNDTSEGGDTTIDIDGDGSTAGERDGLEIDLTADADDNPNRKVFSQVYRVEVMTYQWTENTGQLTRNGSLLATHVEDFQVTDQDDGSFQVAITVETRTDDPEFAGGRRDRTLTSTIMARNMIVS